MLRLSTPLSAGQRQNPWLLLVVVLVAGVCGGADAQCAAGAVDLDRPPAGTNCSCDYGWTGEEAGVDCSKCAPGTAKGNYGTAPCVACTPGHVSAGPQRSCTQCRGGSIAPTSGASVCSNCTAGQFAPPGSSVCTDCPPGTYTDAQIGTSAQCSNCSRGSASAIVAATSRTVCKNCSAGSAADEAAPACIDCDAGTYSGPHASICTKCGVGKFSTASGTVTGTVFKGLAPVQVVAADSQSVCTFCTAGFKANSLGASSCDACNVGTFAYAQSTVCSACPPGTSSNNTGARADNVTVCKTCGFGSWSGQAFRFCTLCLAGKYHNLTGVADAGFCKECLAGRYSAPGSSACLDCSTGTHSSAGAAVCLDCAAGTASKARGLAANSATVCSDCAPGNFSVSGSSLCLQCQRGLFSAGSRSGSCTACELGFHNPYVSATSCVECPINTYGNNTGLASCFPCPTDLFARSASIAIQDCRTAQIEVSPDDKDWGPIIESAPSFAMIFLRPGTYVGYCNLKVNAVKIEGIMGKELTIIDCQGKNRHLSIDGTRNITLIGITLMNGDSGHEDGGCVSMTRGVLTLVDSLLVNCRSGGSGGAIHVSIRSLIDIRRSEFDGCHAIKNGGCLAIKNSTLKLTQSTIRDGHSVQLGGALYLQDISDLTASATSISDCTAAGGGAMAFRGVRIEAQVSGVAFSNNAATSYQDGMMSGGGAVLVLDKTAVNLTSCLFTDNSANYSGGALRIDTSSSMTATSSDFLRNTARLFGGCVRVGDGCSFSGHDNMFDTNLGYKGAGVIAFSDTSSGGALVNSRFIFDQQTAWLGGPESVTQNFAMCLAGTQDGLPGDHSGAFLQQPCVDCTTAQCWGLLQVGWTGTSCQVLADGWRPSRFDRCGARDKWRWPLFQLPRDYYTFYQPPPPPHPDPKNNPRLEQAPYEWLYYQATQKGMSP